MGKNYRIRHALPNKSRTDSLLFKCQHFIARMFSFGVKWTYYCNEIITWFYFRGFKIFYFRPRTQIPLNTISFPFIPTSIYWCLIYHCILRYAESFFLTFNTFFVLTIAYKWRAESKLQLIWCWNSKEVTQFYSNFDKTTNTSNDFLIYTICVIINQRFFLAYDL